MNVACSSCPAKYAVPDEKVRGRKVRITCKRCGAAIIVDGTGLAAGAADAAPAPSTTSAPAPTAPAAPPVASNDSLDGAAPAVAPAARPEADIPTTIGSALSESGASNATRGVPGESAGMKPANDAAAAGGAKLSSAKPAGATAKPLTSVDKAGEAKAGAFPKPGTAAKGPMLGTPLGGAAKAATSVAGAVAAKGATPGKAATAALGNAASAKATPLTAAGANPAAGGAARGAVATAQAARAVVPRVAGAAAPAVAPSALPERTWTVAVTDDDHHEMTLAQIVEAYASEKIDAETFIWRDGMQDWLMPFEIGEIAMALRARRLVPRTNAAATAGTAPLGEDPPPGAWREPGRWDRNDGPPEEPSFDDVTVAMEAPKAKALLQAVSSEEAAKNADAQASKPITAKNDEPTMIPRRKPTSRRSTLPVTPASLGFGFGLDDDAPSCPPAPTESIAAIAESLEREPERLPFELAPSAAAPRAALRSGTNETGNEKPRDLFARGTRESDATAEETAGDDADSAAKALTGARNESSVLFSLDQLAKPAAKAASASGPEEDGRSGAVPRGRSRSGAGRRPRRRALRCDGEHGGAGFHCSARAIGTAARAESDPGCSGTSRETFERSRHLDSRHRRAGSGRRRRVLLDTIPRAAARSRTDRDGDDPCSRCVTDGNPLPRRLPRPKRPHPLLPHPLTAPPRQRPPLRPPPVRRQPARRRGRLGGARIGGDRRSRARSAEGDAAVVRGTEGIRDGRNCGGDGPGLRQGRGHGDAGHRGGQRREGECTSEETHTAPAR